MSVERQSRPRRDIDVALEELRGVIRRRYPEATFEVRRAADAPEAVHLVATVDVENLDEVVDLVIERELEMQIEQGLPIHVIPLRPIERVLALRHAGAAGRPRAMDETASRTGGGPSRDG